MLHPLQLPLMFESDAATNIALTVKCVSLSDEKYTGYPNSSKAGLNYYTRVVNQNWVYSSLGSVVWMWITDN